MGQVDPDGGDLTDLGQSCGGFIDPVSLNATGYLNLQNQTTTKSKGYVCPLGQVCKVRRFTLLPRPYTDFYQPGSGYQSKLGHIQL